MNQEDGFIEVTVNLFNRRPLTRWVRPVILRRLPLLFDVYAWVFIARATDLDFRELAETDAEEFLSWALYGGYVSYATLGGRRAKVTIEEAQGWVRGLLVEDRRRVLKTIASARTAGQLITEYQEAKSEGEGDAPKEGSVSVPTSSST